jgi:hypothetical protein
MVCQGRPLATFQAAGLMGSLTQGIGLRPKPWAGISRPVGPDYGRATLFEAGADAGLPMTKPGSFPQDGLAPAPDPPF